MMEEIIKALEYCQITSSKGCEACPYYNETDETRDCLSKLCADTLALINRQKADCKSLQETLSIFKEDMHLLIERRQKEAIKEFAERYLKQLETYDEYDELYVKTIRFDIDNLAKEMTGG